MRSLGAIMAIALVALQVAATFAIGAPDPAPAGPPPIQVVEPEAPAPTAPVPAPERRHIRWLEWERASFETAASMRRPVLLYLRAADCRLCLQLEQGALDDPGVVEAVGERMVPIAVDVDRRPDLASRYLQFVAPTVTFLLPNGEPMYRLGDESSLRRVSAFLDDPRRLLDYLGVVADYMRANAPDLVNKSMAVADLERSLRVWPPAPPPLDRVDTLAGRVRDGFDFQYGGHGTGFKVIDDGPARLFRLRAELSGESAAGKGVVQMARAMLAGEISDRVEGGFHYYATQRDWGVPAQEKRLDANARALRVLVAAALLAPEDAELRAAVASTADFILRTLRLEDGALALSQHGGLNPEDPGTYFAADAAHRLTLRAPPVEPAVIAADNARAVVALLEAGALLGREDLETAALGALDATLGRLYERGRGVRRAAATAGAAVPPALLTDQAAMLEALLAAHAARGRALDRERAEDIFAFCLANLRVASGPFIDRVEDRQAVGLLRRPLAPLADNGRVALAGIRLALLTGSDAPRQVAAEVLGALSGALEHLGGDDAPYVEALWALRGPPLIVRFAGREPDPKLRRASFLIAWPGLTLAPPLEAGEGPPSARLCNAQTCGPDLTTVNALVAGLRQYAVVPGAR